MHQTPCVLLLVSLEKVELCCIAVLVCPFDYVAAMQALSCMKASIHESPAARVDYVTCCATHNRALPPEAKVRAVTNLVEAIMCHMRSQRLRSMLPKIGWQNLLPMP